jgi:hypothetical protein
MPSYCVRMTQDELCRALAGAQRSHSAMA